MEAKRHGTRIDASLSRALIGSYGCNDVADVDVQMILTAGSR